MQQQYSTVKPESLKALNTLQDITEIQKLAGQMINLPSPPNIIVRILEAVNDDDSCFDELSKIISADSALVIKLLKVANSSMYGVGSRIKNIESALAMLGINALKNIALSFLIVRRMQGESDGYFDFQYFWKRSVTAAVAAKMMAPLNDYDSDDAFVGGLLQDFGVLVFFHHCTDSYMEVMALKHSIGAPGPVVEKQLLGLCHAELGGALLKNWGLPESIYQPVFYHHRQDSVPLRHQVSVEILSLADKISAIYHGSQSSSNLAQVVKSLSDQYGLSEEEIKKLIDNVASRANEMMDFFDIPGGNIRPLSEMLQEANRELGQLNCNYEQLVMELKQTREESSQYVSKLIDANKKYRELAYLDELTGIYNNHYFQKVMDVELARTNRYKRALSLLFLDVDHFKQCNDNHGHLAGDTVLRQVALNIQQIMRASDSVVRYGGDEFAVILPETDSKGLEVFAERIRRSIANMRIDIDDTQMQVTVSVGGATFDGNNPTIDKRDLLRAADQALYQSKREGRNRTSIAADI